METHHFFMGKSTISMAMFNSFLSVYQRVLFCSRKLRNHNSVPNQESIMTGCNEVPWIILDLDPDRLLHDS
jgi:hypothetical protein